METITRKTPESGYNLVLLKEEAAQQFGARFIDLNETEDGRSLTVYVTDKSEGDEAAFAGLVNGHDKGKEAKLQKRQREQRELVTAAQAKGFSKLKPAEQDEVMAMLIERLG